MNYTSKKLSKKVSNLRKQSFKQLYTRAFPQCSVTGQNIGVYPKQKSGDLAKGSPLFHESCLGKLRNPLGYGEGLCIRISLLETRIQNLIEVGDREALKKALREYVEAWLSLEKGGSLERLP